MKSLLPIISILIFLTPLGALPPRLDPPKPLNFSVPKTKRFELSNKAVIHLLEDQELPQIQMTIKLPSGEIYDPSDKIGLASLYASVLPHGGTKKLDADALTKELELMGSSISAGPADESLSIDLFSLKKNFPRTLEILGLLIQEPELDADKLDTEKKKRVAAIQRRNDEPRQIVGREFRRMVYGPESPWGRRTEIRTIQSVSRRDLLDFHRKNIVPNKAIVAVSGAITEAELKGLIETSLGEKSWPNQPQWQAPVAPPLAQSEIKRTIYLIPKETAQQTAVRLGHFGVERHHPDTFRLTVFNEILGGGFTSRLFRNVRSRKGLAYSVGSGFTQPKVKGLLLSAVGTKAETTAQAIEEVIDEIESLKKEKVTDEEMSTAKGQIINSFLANFRTSHQTAHQIADLEFFQYPSDYLDKYTDNIDKVAALDVLNMAVQYWNPEKAIIVVVGNPKKFDRDLSTLGPVKILDAESGAVAQPSGSKAGTPQGTKTAQ